MILFGKMELTPHGLQMQSPEYEVLRQEHPTPPPRASDDDTLHTGRIVPVYEKTGTLTTKMQRVLVHEALAQLPATLPDPHSGGGASNDSNSSIAGAALQEVHFPPDGIAVDELNRFRSPAQRRLIFEEFFLFQLGLILRKRRSRGGAEAARRADHRRDPRRGRAGCCRSG